MPAKKYDIQVEQGETFKFGLRLKDSANGNSFATALSAKSQVRSTPDSPIIVAEFDCTFSENNETLWITLEPDVTQALKPQSSNYDVRVTWPDRVDFVVVGKVKVLPRTTRNG